MINLYLYGSLFLLLLLVILGGIAKSASSEKSKYFNRIFTLLLNYFISGNFSLLGFIVAVAKSLCQQADLLMFKYTQGMDHSLLNTLKRGKLWINCLYYDFKY